MDDEKKKQLGIYEKYRVVRMDREDRPGRKHDGCRYFVLDIDHDPFAVPAVRAYAVAARKEGYAFLADDLERAAVQLERKLADEKKETP